MFPLPETMIPGATLGMAWEWYFRTFLDHWPAGTRRGGTARHAFDASSDFRIHWSCQYNGMDSGCVDHA